MRRVVPASEAGSASAYVQRGLVIFAVLWQVAWSATEIVPRALDIGGAAIIVSCATAVTWLFLVSTLWGPRWWRRFMSLAIVLDLATLAIAAVTLSVVPVEAGTWPIGTIAAVRAAVFATIVLTTGPGLVIAATISVASVVTLIAGPASVGFDDAILQTLYAVALSLGAAALTRGMRRLAARTDEAHRRLADEHTSSLVRADVERSTVGHERRLHDQVLNSLAAIGRGALSDTASIRERCRESATSLRLLVAESPLTRSDTHQVVHEALTTLPAGWTVHRHYDQEQFALVPDDVSAAFAAATAEAIRNAARHSGGSVLTVSTRQDGPTHIVQIDDDGHGLTDDAVAGLGMARSIRGAMVGCGGSATWRTSPRGGVRVELRWTPSSEAGGDSVVTLAADAMRVLPAIGPPFLLAFLGYGVLVVAAGWPYYPQPQWAGLWLAIAVAAAPFAGAVPRVARWVGLTGGPSWSWRVVVGMAISSLAAFAVVRLEVLAVAGAEMPVWVTWSSEVAVGLLFMTVLLGPPWTLAPVLVVWVLAQGGGLAELIQPGAVMLMIAAVFAWSMRRRARDYAQTNAQLLNERARNEAAALDEQRRRQRFDSLATYTAVLLDGISDGSLDPHDVDVRQRCLLEERVARSLVRVDREEGAIESLLHDVVVRGRERGVFVDADVLGAGSAPWGIPRLDTVRAEVIDMLSTRLPPGALVRFTAGWEDDRVVVRLLAELDGEEHLWEWEVR